MRPGRGSARGSASINTDQGTAAVWASRPYRVVAVDGRDVNEPTDVVGRRVLVPAGGRVDLEVVVADSGAARLRRRRCPQRRGRPCGGASPRGAPAAAGPRPAHLRHRLPLGFDAARPDRTYDYVIGRRPGPHRRPARACSGRSTGGCSPTCRCSTSPRATSFGCGSSTSPDEVHPMHLHGHHIVVLSRNGIAAQGSPWWVDSLDVHPGESYERGLRRRQPGHLDRPLPHPSARRRGLVAHVMYDGVTTPFTIRRRGEPTRMRWHRRLRSRGTRLRSTARVVGVLVVLAVVALRPLLHRRRAVRDGQRRAQRRRRGRQRDPGRAHDPRRTASARRGRRPGRGPRRGRVLVRRLARPQRHHRVLPRGSRLRCRRRAGRGVAARRQPPGPHPSPRPAPRVWAW